MWLPGLLAILLGCAQVQAKAVFAHFMVENAKVWSVDQWKVDIRLAQAAHIDGFALNIRADDKTLGTSLAKAFEAADSLGFKMIFSFDYAGGGPWSRKIVTSMILLYSGFDSYFSDNEGRPVVSTFEGPSNAGDWQGIIRETNAAFIPDWSSLGAKAALAAAPCVPHGLFSWAPWPWGNTNGNTYVDASYIEFIEAAEKNCDSDLQYMMPASPWFYTNLPGYNKNWLWRGDDLWFDRWEQIRFINPDYVQIISWNDFGESHHIGPLYVEGDSYEAFTVGEAPFNYALDMPHDGWRELLPFTIDLYKTGVATITQEKLVAWYRVTPKSAPCDDGWTTGNTASQLQLEFTPQDVVEDKIFYSALLTTKQPVTVTVGGINLAATWTKTPSGGAGIYHGSVKFGSNTGAVVVTVGSMTVNKRPIKASCDDTSGYTNWNAFVASAAGAKVNAVVNSTQWVCIEGTAAAGFDEVCAYTCKYGYCPVGACLCTKMGPSNKLPDEKTPGFGTIGFPAKGRSASYAGLCSFACNYGFPCPNAYCDTTEHELVIPNVSPFTPDACTSGVGEGSLGGLCGFSCNFGFCPIHSCTCTSTGALHVPPAQTEGITGEADPGVDERIYGPLCEFACSRGYCPEGVCVQAEVDDGNSHKDVNPVYIGTQVYETPKAACESPCVLVLPPSGLPTTTTIHLPPYTTSFEVGSTTTTVTLYPSDIVTDKISYSNINITGSITEGAVFPRCTSMEPDAVPLTLTFVSNSKTTVTIRQVELPPWPQITQGPPNKWSSTCGGWATGTLTDDDEVIFIPPSATTSTPIPTYTNGPPGIRVDPITEPLARQCTNNVCPEDEEDDEDDDSVVVVKVKCDELWFFIFCIDTEHIKVFGWKFTFPKSVIGPGPPPPIDSLISGWKLIHPPLPHWPKITVGPGLKYPDRPSDCDDNKLEVPVEMYTRSFGLSVSNGVTVTTTTRTITETAYETGCPLPQYTTTEDCGGGNLKRQVETLQATAAETAAAQATHGSALLARDDWSNDMDSCSDIQHTVFFMEMDVIESDIDLVMARLARTPLANHRYQHPALGTILLYVKDLPLSLCYKLRRMPGVGLYTRWKPDQRLGTAARDGNPRPRPAPARNTTAGLKRRTFDNPILDDPDNWHRSHISWPPGVEWNVKGDKWSAGYVHPYAHDGVLGAGQYIYITDDGLDGVDPEFANANIARFELEYTLVNRPIDDAQIDHGTDVAHFAVGQTLGLVPAATLVIMELSEMSTQGSASDAAVLIQLLAIVKDVESYQRQGKCVINHSFVAPKSYYPRFTAWSAEYFKIYKYLEGTLGCVLVASAGNQRRENPQLYPDTTVPAVWSYTGELSSLMVVAASSIHGLRAMFSLPWRDHTDSGMTWAPGLDLYNGMNKDLESGTSLATPLVAGLVAYLRALPSPFANDLKNPAFAVKMVKYLSRKIQVVDPTNSYDYSKEQRNGYRRIIWNGNVGVENCLVGYSTGYQTANARRICAEYRKGLPQPGHTDNWTPDTSVSDQFWSGSGGGSSGVTWHSGPAQPTCTANCGKLCTGYYCVPKPSGNPPDFADPINTPTPTRTTSTTMPTFTPVKPDKPIASGQTSLRVLLFYDQVYNGLPENENKRVVWRFARGRTNGAERDVCSRDYLIAEWAASLTTDPNNPGIPEAGYNSRLPLDAFPGYGQCYFADWHEESARGTIYCDTFTRFRCTKENAPYISCDGGDYKLKPALRCDFPAIPEE